MNILESAGSVQLWGGIECSVTRVGDRFNDQIERSGHAHRINDLDLIYGLGIHTIRYPLVWERTVGYRRKTSDWSWSDSRLNRLKELEMTPIVGLLHHGSGPAWTSLLDDDFPKYFADYALEVANRYPWLRYFTPVNEPLTTARFSGLYGHWFPHHCSDESFIKALFNQCRATKLAMDAIRSVIPEAQQLQTEDLAFISSTPELQYQAEFENHRRWLSLDILCGKVNSDHPLVPYLQSVAKVTDKMLDEASQMTSIPDIVGFNHYVTSNRFLDHRLHLYPETLHASNGINRYADVESVRVDLTEVVGLDELLLQAWARYQLPLAVTEVHLTCNPDQQVRWLHQCWNAVCSASQIADIRGMTAWALFGLYDWNSLTIERNNFYEPGVFDVQNDEPKPTLLADVIKEITQTGDYNETLSASAGWWETVERICYPAPIGGGVTA